MATEEMDPSCSYAPQWTEEAHGLYLSFLEDAFVDDLYKRLYCSVDICGFSAASTSHSSPSSIAAECPSPVPPHSSVAPQTKFSAEAKGCRKRARTGFKAGATKRKGKWVMADSGGNDLHIFEQCHGPGKSASLQEQPGSRSQPFGVCECVVPKGPRGGAKRSRVKGVNERLSGIEQLATDQVVPSVCQEE